MRRVACLLLFTVAACAQYEAEPAGEPPAEIAAAILPTLNKTGVRIVDSEGNTYAEIWLRASAPAGLVSQESNVTLPMIPSGTLVGVMHLMRPSADRRGQTIAAGVYTLRYANFPMTGDHRGAAPQRDFLLLCPADTDQSTNTVADFTALVDLSRKASGMQHPGVLSFWRASSDAKWGMDQYGDGDWVLTTPLGHVAVSIIVIGIVPA
jgi:hypothetical protein